jgi:hypothetical protein
MTMQSARAVLLAVAALAAAATGAEARFLRGGSYYYGGPYGSLHSGGLFGGAWGWYGERRGFYGGFDGAYHDGAQVRPVDGRPFDESRCENLYVKVRKKDVARTRQIYRCH